MYSKLLEFTVHNILIEAYLRLDFEYNIFSPTCEEVYIYKEYQKASDEFRISMENASKEIDKIATNVEQKQRI